MDNAYEAEAEAVEMRKDIALTTRIAVFVPGATQKALLLQDGEPISQKGEECQRVRSHFKGFYFQLRWYIFTLHWSVTHSVTGQSFKLA